MSAMLKVGLEGIDPAVTETATIPSKRAILKLATASDIGKILRMRKLNLFLWAFAGLILLGANGVRAQSATSVKLMLDWKPEPEFGGFYAARINGAFASNGLDVTIKSAGEGAPTWQLVATGLTDFATTAADQVLIARSQGADVVALFSVYQTFPQGVMVHKARGFTKLEDVFTHPGTLAAEDDVWLRYCKMKFEHPLVKTIGYSGGIAAFLSKPEYSQQCFVTSEPLTAMAAGSDPQTFLIADAGYNPYTTVVIARGEMVRSHPELIEKMTKACRQGWRAYLDNPTAANQAMGKLNKEMDAATFTAAAEAQKPLIETDETRKAGLGTMSADRWEALSKQLVELKVINKPVSPQDCFVNKP